MDRAFDENYMVDDSTHFGRCILEAVLTENPSSTPPSPPGLSHLFGRVFRLDLSVAVNLNDDRLSVSPTFSPSLALRPSAVVAVLSRSVDDGGGGGGDDDGRRGSRSLSPSLRQSAYSFARPLNFLSF